VDLLVRKEAKALLALWACLVHQEQKEAEVCLDPKENKEDQVLLEVLVSLAELVYLA
jgi:hypothetical protein